MSQGACPPMDHHDPLIVEQRNTLEQQFPATAVDASAAPQTRQVQTSERYCSGHVDLIACVICRLTVQQLCRPGRHCGRGHLPQAGSVPLQHGQAGSCPRGGLQGSVSLPSGACTHVGACQLQKRSPGRRKCRSRCICGCKADGCQEVVPSTRVRGSPCSKPVTLGCGVCRTES